MFQLSRASLVWIYQEWQHTSTFQMFSEFFKTFLTFTRLNNRWCHSIQRLKKSVKFLSVWNVKVQWGETIEIRFAVASLFMIKLYFRWSHQGLGLFHRRNRKERAFYARTSRIRHSISVVVMNAEYMLFTSFEVRTE